MAPPAPPPAARRAKQAASRHSRIVRLAKILLPIIGIVVAGIVILRTVSFSFIPGLNMPAVLFSKDGLTMVEPRLAGRSNDRAYDIGATRAVQDFANPKVVKFEQIDGRIEMNNGSWVKLTAKQGTYDGNKEGLVLAGNVIAVGSNGYTLNAQDADIDLAKGNMATDHPVHISGPAGVVDSGGARVLDSGKSIQLINGIRMTINPEALPQQRPAPAEPAVEGAPNQ